MNNKKLVFEIIIIPICILYLILTFLKSTLVSGILLAVFSVVTAIWFVPKYIDEIYVYKSKNNFLKLIYIIGNILLASSSILYFILKLKIFKILIIISTLLVALELLHFGIKNLKEVINKKKENGINILHSFFSFMLFAIILGTIIICIK